MLSREVDFNTITPSIANSEADNMPTTTLPAAPNISPFLLKAQDVEVLAQSDGFNVLREHMAQHYTYEWVLRKTSTAHTNADSHVH